jgi:ATP-binding cassette subfamily B protein
MSEAKTDTVISINLRAIRLINNLRKRLIPSFILNALFNNLAPYVTLYMSAEIINELVGAKDTARLTALVLFTVIADLVIVAVGRLWARFKEYEWYSFMYSESRMFMIHDITMDYAYIEDPKIQQRRRKIIESSRINSLGIGSLVYSLERIPNDIIQIILSICFASSLFTLLFTRSAGVLGAVVFPFILIALIALSVFISMRNAKKLSALSEEMSNGMLTVNRLWQGFRSDYNSGKEVRLYKMKDIYANFHKQSREAHVKYSKKYWRGYRNTQIPDQFISQGINFTIYAFICLNAVRGLFEIGSVVKYVGFISRLVSALASLSANVATVKMNAPFLAYYLNFLAIENKMYQGTLTTEKRVDNEYSLEFHNVSFKYSGSETYALKNLNLRLNIGQRLAVVGMNGSGKTTMIKLLCRLYDPTEGEITLNGIDIKKYDYEEYLDLFSVVFQDFKLFSFPLGQNIATSIKYDESRAENCLNMAGLKDRYEEMPKGMETPLYKDFEEDGVEISGGEAQKIALARALYKDAPFMVLDEPTAALDPIAEFEVYQKFNEIVGDKTAICISHRLSSCRFCDDIAVFHEGELIQRGNHDTLLADMDGKYYELWNAQAQYYAEG